MGWGADECGVAGQSGGWGSGRGVGLVGLMVGWVEKGFGAGWRGGDWGLGRVFERDWGLGAGLLFRAASQCGSLGLGLERERAADLGLERVRGDLGGEMERERGERLGELESRESWEARFDRLMGSGNSSANRLQ